MIVYQCSPIVLKHRIVVQFFLFQNSTQYSTTYFTFLKQLFLVAFKIYDMDRDGYISNGELFQVLKMMVGSNLKDTQLQQIVDKTILFHDKDGDGKISFKEFCDVSVFYSILILDSKIVAWCSISLQYTKKLKMHLMVLQSLMGVY